jgi:hypothetical protein
VSELYEGCRVIVNVPDCPGHPRQQGHPRHGCEGHVAVISRDEPGNEPSRPIFWVEFRDAGDRLRLPFWGHELTPRTAFGGPHGR